MGGELILRETVLNLGRPSPKRLTFEVRGLDANMFVSSFGFKEITAAQYATMKATCRKWLSASDCSLAVRDVIAWITAASPPAKGPRSRAAWRESGR